MKHSVAALAFFLAIGISSPADPATPQAVKPLSIAQVEPPETRTPVAVVDPNQPIQIRVVNQSEIDVDIIAQLLQPPSNERNMAPGEFVTFGRLHTSFLPPPLELQVFTKENDILLDDLEIAVENNEIIVAVVAESGVSGGVRVVRVNQSGEIYLF